MYPRLIRESVEKWLNTRDVIIIYGARQTGKTTIITELLKKISGSLILNCEKINIVSILESGDINAVRSLFGRHSVIALDEAQKIGNIGSILKLIYDELPEYKIIATGSSSFELTERLAEPLTGRNVKFRLYPLSLKEIGLKHGWHWITDNMNNLLIYGTYPGHIDLPVWQKQQKVVDLTSDYLFKDIFALDRIRSSALLRKLLRALAFQVGGEVSVNELSQLTGMARATVERYLDLLEKCFVIYRLESFSSNLRNEIKKSRKYYFTDNGLLNSLIGNFNPIENRTDQGMLWENFAINEIVKHYHYSRQQVNFYFWRSYNGPEIDLVAEHSGKLKLYECKWRPGRKVKVPEVFRQKYKTEEMTLISPSTLYRLFETDF